MHMSQRLVTPYALIVIGCLLLMGLSLGNGFLLGLVIFPVVGVVLAVWQYHHLQQASIWHRCAANLLLLQTHPERLENDLPLQLPTIKQALGTKLLSININTDNLVLRCGDEIPHPDMIAGDEHIKVAWQGGTRQIHDSVVEMVRIIKKTVDAYAIQRERMHRTHYDALTGCMNGDSFYQSLDEQLQRPQNQLLVGMLDLDDFKNLNDTKGHAAGDEVLKQVGMRLDKELAMRQGVASRLHGDEFAFWVPAATLDSSILKTQLTAIHQSLIPPIDFVTGTTPLGVSLGGVLVIGGVHGLEEAIRAADAAMYHSKSKGKNAVSIMTPKHPSSPN